MSKQEHYTAKDIERYHQGEMTAAEMHRLEKAALDDPLLADALEGYVHTATAAYDVAALQTRLQQRTGGKKNNRVTMLQQPWLRLAALFILIAGGGWLVFRTATTRENDLAISSPEKAPAEQATVATADSLPTPFSAATDAADSNRLSGVTAMQKTAAAPPVLQATRAEKKEPKKETAVMEALRLPAADQASAAGSSTPKDNTTTQVDRITTDTLLNQSGALQKAEAAAEAPVMQRRRQAAPQVGRTASAAEPAAGWEAFEKYLAQNKTPEPERKTAFPSGGEVALQFLIGQNGRPESIEVTQSLCERCDAEAVRLLKEGPAWKKPGEKGSVKIRF